MDCKTRAIELGDIVVIRGNNSKSVRMRSLANGNSRGSHNDGISDGKRNTGNRNNRNHFRWNAKPNPTNRNSRHSTGDATVAVSLSICVVGIVAVTYVSCLLCVL